MNYTRCSIEKFHHLVIFCLVYLFLFSQRFNLRHTIFMSRTQMMKMMKNSGHQILQDQITFLQKEIVKKICFTRNCQKKISTIITRFKSQFKIRWKAAQRKEDSFLKKNKTWIYLEIVSDTLDCDKSKNGN